MRIAGITEVRCKKISQGNGQSNYATLFKCNSSFIVLTTFVRKYALSTYSINKKPVVDNNTVKVCMCLANHTRLYAIQLKNQPNQIF
jgi:hypothetical protein